MKLEGSLDAFSLPDVFQLLSYTKKTGGLHLAHDGSDGVVFFSGGEVTGASSDGSRLPLARRLIGAGSVDDDALAAAVARVSEGEGVGVARALLEAGAVDAEVLRGAARDQAVDAVFDLLRWRDGDFAFVLDEANPDDVGYSATAADILAEAEARRGSWETVSRVVPSPEVVLSMPVVLSGDPVVSRDEWALLALVDGRRTVAELVDLAGCGQYAVVSTLAALVERSLLAVSDETGDHAGVVSRRHALLAPLEQTFVPVVAPEPLVAEPVADPGPEGAETAPEPVTEADSPRPADAEPEGESAEDESAEDRPAVDVAEDAAADEPAADETDGAETDGAETDGAEIDGAEIDGAETDGAETDGAETDEAESHGAEDAAEASGDDAADGLTTLGGAHVPGDVVPPRPEPFLPKRQADYDDEHVAQAPEPAHALAGRAGGNVPVQIGAGGGEVVGATAVAADPSAPIERDPSVNRSLMLRLIAGVRGL